MQKSSAAGITGHAFVLGIFSSASCGRTFGSLSAEKGLGDGSLVAHWKFKEGSGNAVADFPDRQRWENSASQCAGAEVGYGRVRRFDPLWR